MKRGRITNATFVFYLHWRYRKRTFLHKNKVYPGCFYDYRISSKHPFFSLHRRQLTLILAILGTSSVLFHIHVLTNNTTYYAHIDCNIMLSHWNMVTSGHLLSTLMLTATYKNQMFHPQAHNSNNNNNNNNNNTWCLILEPESNINWSVSFKYRCVYKMMYKWLFQFLSSSTYTLDSYKS